MRYERGAHKDGDSGEEVSAGQAEAGIAWLFAAKHRQRGAADGVIEQAGDGGERYIPFEFAGQCECPDQRGEYQNRNVGRVEPRMDRGEGFGEISLLGKGET